MPRLGKRLKKALRLLGFAPTANSPEVDWVVARWLRNDFRGATPARWRECLEGAIALGREVYREINEAFGRFFHQPADARPESDSVGLRQVRRWLWRYFATEDGRLEEAIMARILAKRRMLLHRIRGRYQPTLFGPMTIVPEGFGAYFTCVTRFETLRVAPGEMRLRYVPCHAEIPERPAASEAGPDEGPFRAVAELVPGFWSDHGFSRPMWLEGMISLGLGMLTDDATLARRCNELLQVRLPDWEQRRSRLRRRSSRLLEEHDKCRREFLACPEDAERLRTRLGDIETRLERCSERLAAHPHRLLPRPAEVAQILEGYVQGKVGGLRFGRIRCEIAVLCDRFLTGWARLQRSGLNLDEPLVQLAEDLMRHAESRPPSSGQRGLSPEERAGRRGQLRTWRTEANRLLGRIRSRMANPMSDDLASWLADAENYYEFGVQGRRGILHGPGRRHGWRLRHLFRGRTAGVSPGVDQ